jgi:DNA-binding beta-propeller fold protein YncE
MPDTQPEGATKVGRNARPLILSTVKQNVSLTAVDAETGTIAHTVEVGTVGSAKPHEITLSADGSRAYVSLYGSADYGPNVPDNRIAVVDLDGMTLAGHIDLGLYRGPHALATGADGRIWATVDPNRCVLVIDPDTWQIERTIWLQVPGHFFAKAPDGNTLYVSAKEYPVIAEIDMDRRAVAATIDVPVGAQGIRVSTDGKWLYAGDFNRPLLHVIDCGTRRLADTVPLAGVPGWPFVSPDGKSVVVTTYDAGAERGYAEILDASDLRRRRAVELPAEPFHVLFDEDSTHFHIALADGEVPRIGVAAAAVVDGGFAVGGTMPEALVRWPAG